MKWPIYWIHLSVKTGEFSPKILWGKFSSLCPFMELLSFGRVLVTLSPSTIPETERMATFQELYLVYSTSTCMPACSIQTQILTDFCFAFKESQRHVINSRLFCLWATDFKSHLSIRHHRRAICDLYFSWAKSLKKTGAFVSYLVLSFAPELKLVRNFSVQFCD